MGFAENLPESVNDVKRSDLQTLVQCVRNRWDDCANTVAKCMPILDSYVDQIAEQMADENNEENPKIRGLLSIIRTITEYYAMSNQVAANADKASRLDSGQATDRVITQQIVLEEKPEGWTAEGAGGG